jgi:hypothetical protein
MALWNPNNYPIQTVRTPDAPGVDQHCATDCPDGGFVYGLGFKVPGPQGYPMGAVTVTVGSPWQIIAGGDPYCDYSDAFGPGRVWTGCASFDVVGGSSFDVMTTDPSAVARNIKITFTASPQMCPPDGGP